MGVGIIIIFQVKFKLGSTEVLKQLLELTMGLQRIFGHLRVWSLKWLLAIFFLNHEKV